MKVVDVMTKDPLTVTPSEAIGQADELMNGNKIRQLPVVEDNELVGIVTDRDIRSFLSASKRTRRAQSSFQRQNPTHHDHRSRHGLT